MFVAVRKTKGKSRWSQAVVIFWLVFIIVIVGFFLVKRDDIQKNFNLFTNRLSSPPGQEEEKFDEPADDRPPISIVREPAREPSDQRPSDERPVDERPSDRGLEPQGPADDPVARPPGPQEPTSGPAETRDRNLYFTRIDNDGQILRFRVSRKIAVSDSPLYDVLGALLAGPGTEEGNRGIISLIPPDTRLLSAIVRGGTAYISFNEDFQFNTYGVEGYAAQLRQIIWTTTEFSTVNDVQILIEGKRVDYLAEGIWIGSPLDRQSY